MLTEVPRVEPKRAPAWIGSGRGYRARPLEKIIEKLIFLVSLSAIVMIFLIFVFIGKEAAPVIFGQMNSAAVQEVIPPDQIDQIPPEQLRAYLDLTPEEFEEMPFEVKQALMEVKMEGA